MEIPINEKYRLNSDEYQGQVVLLFEARLAPHPKKAQLRSGAVVN